MSNKGSSASFIHTKKIAIIFRATVAIFAFLVIFSLISCEGGVYSEKNTELLYTHDYDSVSYGETGGWGNQYPASIDFSNSENAIIAYDYRSNVNFIYQIEIFSNPLSCYFVNYIRPLPKTEDYKNIIDTIKLKNKGPADNFQVTFDRNPYVDTGQYSVVRNLQIYSN